MTTARVLRQRAARCAALSRQTYDEEGRERYLRLEQTFLELADAKDREARANANGDSYSRPAA